MKLFNLFVLIFVSLNLIYLSNASSTTCENCLKEGEKCMTSYNIGSTTYYRDEKLCSSGYVCGPFIYNDDEADFVCMELAGENERCFENDLCEVGLTCNDENICVSGQFAMVGDKCDIDSDCYRYSAKCIDGTCQTQETECNSNSDCSANYYCKYSSTGYDMCVPRLTLGQVCSPGSDFCANDLVCDTNGVGNYYCKTPTFKQIGDSCSSSSSCDKTNGLYCSRSSSKCERYIEQTISFCNVSGFSFSQYCDEFHTCSSCDGKCYQSSLYPTQYLEYQKPLIDCAIMNNCTLSINVNIESSDSCVSRNCGSEYCKSLRGINTENNPRSCQRDHYVNTYCDRNSSTKLSISMFTLFIMILIVLLI